MRTSSSASTTRVALVLIATIMGYRDVMSTSAPPADPSNELHRLVEEQAALRRVATFVASGAPPAEVFEAVVTEIGQLFRGGILFAPCRHPRSWLGLGSWRADPRRGSALGVGGHLLGDRAVAASQHGG